MGEGNTVLVAIAGGEEEDVGKSGELVAGQLVQQQRLLLWSLGEGFLALIFVQF